MSGHDAIRTVLETTKKDVEMLLADFSDEELFVRPVPNANHVAWQIGNIIAGDIYLVQSEIPDAKFPELPAGYMEQHSSGNTKADGPDGFLKKADYLKLFADVRATTVDVLMKLTDADLDKPTTDSMKAYAATLGVLFIMVSNHTLWHAGQFCVIRRKLGKPILM
jgi:hypothetical protein